jgi:Tfp pilus assembly protein PilV
MGGGANPGRPSAAGLTLVEVLIAAAVLGVAILGTAGAFPTALRQVSYGGQITKATALAHQMMEDVRSNPASSIPWYAGKDGRGVSTDAPANFPDDWPSSCTSGWAWGDQFCGSTKLNRWRQDILGDPGDGRRLASGRGTVGVVDHENPPAGGGGAVSASTTILRITVTVSWDEPTGRKQVALASTVACAWPGCL